MNRVSIRPVTFSNTVPALLFGEKAKAEFLQTGLPARGDGGCSVTVHQQPTPQLRRNVSSEELDHPELRAAERFAHVGAGCQRAVELAHEAETELIVHSPQIRDNQSRTRCEEWTKAVDAFLFLERSAAGLPGGYPSGTRTDDDGSLSCALFFWNRALSPFRSDISPPAF
jgi:hypothetical protein